MNLPYGPLRDVSIQECATYVSQTEWRPFLEHYRENAEGSSREELRNYILNGKHIYALSVLLRCPDVASFERMIDAIHGEVVPYLEENSDFSAT